MGILDKWKDEIDAQPTPFWLDWIAKKFDRNVYEKQKEKQTLKAISGIYGNAHWAFPREVQAMGLFSPDGIPLGLYRANNHPLHYVGEQHLITISPNRTGKGTTAIIPALLEHTASCIVVDPKGQDAAITARRRRELGQEVFFLNPFPDDMPEAFRLPCHGFNPLAKLDPKSPRFVANVAALGEALVLDDGGQRYFTDSARDLVEALIMWVCLDDKEDASLPTVRRALGLSDEKLKELAEELAKHQFRPIANKMSRFTDPQRDALAVLNTARTETKLLDDPAIDAVLSSNSFDWADLKRKPMTVYLILPSDLLESHARWLRLMLSSALSALQSTEKSKKPVLFILDEFAQLGHLSAIENAMGLAAGYGVQLWPILQDLGQLQSVYKQRWESFLANAGITQVLRANDEVTKDYFIKKAGTYTGYASTESSGKGGGGTSVSRAAVNLLQSQEITGAANDLGFLFVNGSAAPVLQTRIPYFAPNSRYQSMYDPDPYHQ